MAEFLTTRGISYNLEKIIKCASEELIIVTPYLKFSTPIYEQLKAVSKNVKISFIYGKTDLNYNEEKLVKDLNCNILFKENLHAKCYLNEQMALVCSMNLHAYSEVNNYEMGVLIDSKLDKKAYEECRNEIKLIDSNSKKIRIIHYTEEIVTKKYKREDVQKAWIQFQKSHFKDQKYEENENGIIIRDYPVKNINLTNNYGIISFEIQLPTQQCRQIKATQYNSEMNLVVTDYRVFWSSPYDKIHLYHAKKIEFNSLESELEYFKSGLFKLIEKLKAFNFR